MAFHVAGPALERILAAPWPRSTSLRPPSARPQRRRCRCRCGLDSRCGCSRPDTGRRDGPPQRSPPRRFRAREAAHRVLCAGRLRDWSFRAASHRRTPRHRSGTRHLLWPPDRAPADAATRAGRGSLRRSVPSRSRRGSLAGVSRQSVRGSLAERHLDALAPASARWPACRSARVEAHTAATSRPPCAHFAAPANGGSRAPASTPCRPAAPSPWRAAAGPLRCCRLLRGCGNRLVHLVDLGFELALRIDRVLARRILDASARQVRQGLRVGEHGHEQENRDGCSHDRPPGSVLNPGC